MAEKPKKDAKKTDYTGGNPLPADAAARNAERVEKIVEQVTETKVVVKKKGIGSKLKSIVSQADLPGVINYVTYDVLIPAARNMIVDGLVEGVYRAFNKGGDRHNRSMYGYGGSSGPRISYGTPVSRGGSPLSRHAPPQSSVLGSRTSRHIRDDFILVSRSEADLVLERLGDIIDQFQVASVADLKELMGIPSTHVDQKWGWVFIGDAAVRQVREGFVLDLPQEEPVQ